MIVINAMEVGAVLLSSASLFLDIESLRQTKREAVWAAQAPLPAPGRFLAMSHMRREYIRLAASGVVFLSAVAMVVTPDIALKPSYTVEQFYFGETLLRGTILLNGVLLVVSGAWDLWDRHTITALPDGRDA